VRIYRHSSKARIRLTFHPCLHCAELTERDLLAKANWNWIHSGLGCSSGRNCWGIIVGQILYTSVSENLKEFGTLKAMGASDRVIYSVIVEQAL